MRTETALVELLKESRDWRTLFKDCCHKSAFRLRSQAYRFKDELATRGYVVSLEAIQDTLFKLARDLFPESPGVDFTAWAELLCRDALARLQEHYTVLSEEEKEAVDLSKAWERNDEIVAACEAEDLGTLREALKDYEREVRAAIRVPKKESGAA